MSVGFFATVSGTVAVVVVCILRVSKTENFEIILKSHFFHFCFFYCHHPLSPLSSVHALSLTLDLIWPRMSVGLWTPLVFSDASSALLCMRWSDRVIAGWLVDWRRQPL